MYMAEKLKQSHGWQYVDDRYPVVRAPGSPDMTTAGMRGSSSTTGPAAAGREPLSLGHQRRRIQAARGLLHGKGLKFGIHLLRGIPRQAVDRENTPILGTNLHAADIADQKNTCPWNSDMYGVDMSKPGAQEYYDSVFALAASWGVDFVKVDDLAARTHRPRSRRSAKRSTNAAARSSSARSPGGRPWPRARSTRCQHVADQRRLLGPVAALNDQFNGRRLDAFRGPGHWPDADMLPLGAIRQCRQATPATHSLRTSSGR